MVTVGIYSIVLDMHFDKSFIITYYLFQEPKYEEKINSYRKKHGAKTFDTLEHPLYCSNEAFCGARPFQGSQVPHSSLVFEPCISVPQ